MLRGRKKERGERMKEETEGGSKNVDEITKKKTNIGIRNKKEKERK